MSASTQREAFASYLKLMLKLYEVDLESVAADDIRDLMDAPWYRMSKDERDLAHRVSAALYDGDSS